VTVAQHFLANPGFRILFVDDPATSALAANALRILSVGIATAGVAPLLAGYYQAIGRATPSYLISIGTVVVIKLPLVMIAGSHSAELIWVALGAGECLSALAALMLAR
jgi:Na+-driven multidrug efflux pump